jgi:hypothetical protein
MFVVFFDGRLSSFLLPSPISTILREACACLHFSIHMIMCNRLMNPAHSVVVIGPATDALERSRKRRRTEEYAIKNDVDFCLKDVYEDLIEHCEGSEESFPSIEWSDSDDSETDDYGTFAEHSALSRSRMFLLFPKQSDNGLRRSKSFRTDLSAMNSEELPIEFLQLAPTLVEPFSPNHFPHLPSKPLKTLSTFSPIYLQNR